MKVKDFINTIAVLIILLSSVSVSSSSSNSVDSFYGVSPQDESSYRSSDSMMKCMDGSKKFSKSKLNDDFCDCPDASDEPGTSACPNGKFFCRNAGHAPAILFSSRVNDGICDCCDGSDEYDGEVNCPNTCWEAGKVARDKLKKKIATYREGVALRNQLVTEAKQAFAKDSAELSKLKDEEKILKDLVQQLKERKEQIEKAEEKERLRKEKERKEAEEKNKTEKTQGGEEAKEEIGLNEEKFDNGGEHVESTDDDKIGTTDDSGADLDESLEHVDPAADDGHTDTTKNEESLVKEVGKESDVSENTEGLSKEELGRLVASRWTGNTEKQSKENDEAKDDDHRYDGDHEDFQEEDTHPEDDADAAYASEIDDDSRKYDHPDMEDDRDETDEDDASSSYEPESNDDLEFSDVSSPSSPTWLEKIQQTVRNILQAVNIFPTPVNISDAAHVRKEFEESSSKLSKLQSRKSSLTQKLKHDFGKEKEFYSFYNNCLESKQNKYVYKVCPYKQASQVEGHSTTRLGSWKKFEDSYRVMVFSDGDRCWNGPDRSLKVKLRCGLKNEVTDVDEPSRCEYVALLSTPALCAEEKLKELEDKLEKMNKPPSHDEL